MGGGVRVQPPAAHEALTYSAAGLPPGLKIGASGVISGTVTSTSTSTSTTVLPKTYRVTLSARNAAGAKSTIAFGWKVS